MEEHEVSATRIRRIDPTALTQARAAALGVARKEARDAAFELFRDLEEGELVAREPLLKLGTTFMYPPWAWYGLFKRVTG